MNKEVLNYIAEKTRELIVAPTCSNETKEAAQAWLNAIGTESEMAETTHGPNESLHIEYCKKQTASVAYLISQYEE